MSPSPSSYDVIVLGVGGMGSAACFHLAKRGLRVLGLEQFQVVNDRGSSHGESRIIRRAYFEHPNYIPLLNRAYTLWDELEAESGKRLFHRCGFALYADPETSAAYSGVLAASRDHGIAVEELSREDALERFPMIRPSIQSRLLLEPDAGLLLVEECVATHVELARRHGAEIREGVRVLDLRVNPGAISVITAEGELTAAKLVVTAGPWSQGLLQDIGVPLELHRLLLYWYPTSSAHRLESGAPCFAVDEPGSFRYGFPSLDGTTIKLASHLSRDPISDPAEKFVASPPVDDQREMETFIRERLPEVRPELERFSTCIYTMTPDEHFVVDVHPMNPNIVYATGFSGHGFKFASVIGEILADLAEQGQTRHPIGFLSSGRFSESRAS